jgi:hypothetical protein
VDRQNTGRLRRAAAQERARLRSTCRRSCVKLNTHKITKSQNWESGSEDGVSSEQQAIQAAEKEQQEREERVRKLAESKAADEAKDAQASNAKTAAILARQAKVGQFQGVRQWKRVGQWKPVGKWKRVGRRRQQSMRNKLCVKLRQSGRLPSPNRPRRVRMATGRNYGLRATVANTTTTPSGKSPSGRCPRGFESSEQLMQRGCDTVSSKNERKRRHLK